MAHTTHIVKIQNLASGDVLMFRDSYIQNYSFRRIVNWDTTNTIGRMDPIKTFKNTEAKVELNFTVVNPHRNIVTYFYDFGLIDTTVYNKQNLDKFFRNPAKTASGWYTKSPDYTSKQGVYGYTENLETIGKILYPSYVSDNSEYSMKSAPVLRVKIYKDRKEENVIFNGYATVNALDVNLKAEDVASPGGRNFSNVEFNILFDVIHTKETDVAAAVQEDLSVSPDDILAIQGESE